MKNVTKTRYTRFITCPKMLWLDTNKYDERVIPAGTEERYAAGTFVGELAKGMFGEYADMSERYPNGIMNTAKMAQKTKQHIRAGTENICEAAFLYNGCYCAVDILHRSGASYCIYEVKSSTSVQEMSLYDISFQKYLIEHNGIRVDSAYIIHINPDYVFEGSLDPGSFFTIEDVTDKLDPYYACIAENVEGAKAMMTQPAEPETKAGAQCKNPYECEYLGYCTKGAVHPGVFELYHINFTDACDLYNRGIMTYQDVKDAGISLTPKQERQVTLNLTGETYVDREGIKSFLSALWYPLCFLDFETFSSVVPCYNGQRPYQQIPFQFSLHIIRSEVAEAEHFEFLAEDGADPRKQVAEKLVEYIPDGACVTAYYKQFECSRLKELAELFPEYSAKLLEITDNCADFLDVFHGGYYYLPAMNGSFSLKSVYPAIFGDDGDTSYSDLEDVHNGLEATSAYLALPGMDAEEKKRTRENLLKYCGLDTLALVKLFRHLSDIANGPDLVGGQDKS